MDLDGVLYLELVSSSSQITQQVLCSVLPMEWASALSTRGWKPADVAQLLDAVHPVGGSIDVYPPRDDVFRAFHETPLACVRTVILGQDPYYDDPRKAHGLAFSVRPGTPVPRSLRMVFRALAADIPGSIDPERQIKDLSQWATGAGVLLLNTALSVEKGRPESHLQQWKGFTAAVLELLRDRTEPVAFLLWGEKAITRGLGVGVDVPPHEVFEAAHPRPGAKLHGRSFAEAHSFRRSNDFLSKTPRGPVNWSLA